MLNLKIIRTQQKVSQQKLADKIGVSRSTVAMWETGGSQPDNEMLKKIADFFNVTTDYLLGRSVPEPDYERLKREGFESYNPNVRKIPVLGYVAAGLPIYADEHIEGYTYTDLENDGFDYFALKVSGDSMNAVQINDGNIVIVRIQQTCSNGDIVVVRVDNENATVKRFNRVGDIVQLIPQSLNPEHKIQEYDLKCTKIDIIGKVVECKVKF